MILDVRFNPAHRTWAELRDDTLAAQDDGFGTVWIFDHLSGRMLRGDRMLECFTLVGALAAATTTIGIGTMVANAALRPAAVLAVAAASAQEISSGRFTFGLGAGAAPGAWWAAEHEAAGISLAPSIVARHQRVEEVLDVCADMWAPDRSDRWAGFPLPSPAPPIVLGANSLRLAEIAGRRTDGLNVRADHPHLALLMARAVQARAAGPMAGHPFSLSVWGFDGPSTRDPDGDFQGHMQAIGVERLILLR